MDSVSRRRIDPPLKEALISLTALAFIEEYRLLAREQLEEARRGLPILFVRTSSEESMLRKLIAILHSTRAIQQSFNRIASILNGIATCVRTVEVKHEALRARFERLGPSAEEQAALVGLLLEFARAFQHRLATLHRQMQAYLTHKEHESKCASVYQIAREARARLRERLASPIGQVASVQTDIHDQAIAAFDYSEAEFNLRQARREAERTEQELRAELTDLGRMCQMARNPTMRDDSAPGPGFGAPPYPDVFMLFAAALQRHPRLAQFKDAVVELFRLYQHAEGMFKLDLQNLQRAIETMLSEPNAYFEAKDEDRDLAAKRERLRRIEALIAFLERAADTLHLEALDTYQGYSRALSDVITAAHSPWEHIAVDLLRAKVQAEAELSTRL